MQSAKASFYETRGEAGVDPVTVYPISSPSDVRFQALQELAKTTPDLIDLAMINSDLLPLRYSIDKLAEATIKPENHHYAVARGIRRLREAFCLRYREKFSTNLNPDTEVCVTQGAKDAIMQVLHTLAEGKRKKILIFSPYYPAHYASSLVAGLEIVLIKASDDESDMVARAAVAFGGGDIAACLTSYPSNPTGVVASKIFWSKMGQVAAQHDVVLINDFVYGELAFVPGGLATSALSARSEGARVVEAYSMSKAFSLAGWRVGALVGDPSIIQSVAQRKSFTGFGIFLPLQIAAAVTLTSQQDLVSTTREAYEQRTRFLANGLKALGFSVSTPQAGICVWATVPAAMQLDRQTSYDLSRRMLEQSKVFASPAGYFGSSAPALRFACVHPQTKLQSVLDRISQTQL